MEPYFGEIRITASENIPQGWLLCNGQSLSINQYAVLYHLMGNRFGGNGTTHFNLPDLRGRVPIAAGQGEGLRNYQLAEKAGTETLPLTTTQAATTGSIPVLRLSNDKHNELYPVMTGQQSIIQPVFATNFMICAEGGRYPHDMDNNFDNFTGEIRMWVGEKAPHGWAICNGEKLVIRDHPALVSLIWDTYGPVSNTHFQLPDMRGRVPVMYGQGKGMDEHRIGSKFGSETATENKPLPEHYYKAREATQFTLVPNGGYPVIQPVLAFNFIIAVMGVFPPKP